MLLLVPIRRYAADQSWHDVFSGSLFHVVSISLGVEGLAAAPIPIRPTSPMPRLASQPVRRWYVVINAFVAGAMLLCLSTFAMLGRTCLGRLLIRT